MRRINKDGITLIKSFEGLSFKPYLDSVNIPTIGYGTILYPNGHKVTMNDPLISEAQALEYLEFEVNQKCSGVERLITVEVNDNEFAALVAFAYNIGLGALSSSTLLKKLNTGDKVGAASEFMRWNKAGGKEVAGLTRRREAERALFLKPTDESTINESTLPDIPSEEDINKVLEEVEKNTLKS